MSCTSTNRSPRAVLAVAVLVAFLSALVHGVVVYRLFGSSGNFGKYTNAAQLQVDGKLNAERVSDFSPLYLALHVAARHLSAEPEALMRLVHLALVAASAALLFLLLDSFFSRRIALAGAFIFVFSRSVIIYGTIFEPEPLLVLLLLAFSLVITREGARHALLAGFLLAGSLLVRPNLFALVLVAPLFFRLRAGAGKRWRRESLFFVAPVALMVVALIARNASQTGARSPLVMNPGTVFFEGNNPLANGNMVVYPPLVFDARYEFTGEPDSGHVLYRLFARRVSGLEMSVAEVNAYWSGKALKFMADHPLDVLAGVGRKAYYFLHNFRGHDIPKAYDLESALDRARFPTVPFCLVSALALVGLVTAVRRFRVLFMVYAIFLLQFCMLLASYSSDRQRVSVIPYFIFFGCAALECALESGRRALLVAVLTGAALTVLLLESDAMRESRHLFLKTPAFTEHLSRAFALRKAGDLARARLSNATAYAAAPWMKDWARLSGLPFGDEGFAAQALGTLPAGGDEHFSERFDRALLLTDAGRFSDAGAVLESLLENGTNISRQHLTSSDLRYHLARAAAGAGEKPRAVSLLEKACSSNPGDPFVLAALAALTGREHYRTSLFRYFDDITASFLLGQAFLENGLPEEAVGFLSYVCSRLPEYRRAQFYRAAALGMSGRTEEAAAAYATAMDKREDSVMLEKEILSALGENAAARHTASAGYLYGRALRQYGRYREALGVLRSIDPLGREAAIAGELSIVERALGSLEDRAPQRTSR